ncbi:VOC family protein [Leifsonia poae]|uniref:Glyoxalase n=1 Tax=Leifsonia poae TaxID=110933 RepID=A0A9W6M0A2_9MICO|nr:VOC family protein [Leifsonia poae]GLJ76666.1 glyoxalase [Leifsonia poae]
MEQRISLVTFGVDDLARARAFYEDGLGWTPAAAQDGVCFYQLNGIGLSLFGRSDLEEDARHPIDGTFSGVTIALNERSVEEVDAVFAQAEAAGARILKAPERVFWGGYSGYFADLDGHVWEVAYNPSWEIADDGSIAIA